MNRQLIYDIAWQKLRVHLKGKTQFYCMQQLTLYLEGANGDIERYMRMKRVINLLNATRMGYHGMGIQGSEEDRRLVRFRESIKDKLPCLGKVKLPPYDPQKVLSDAKQLFREDGFVFKRLYTDVKNRAAHTVQKRGSLDSRKELSDFLEILEAAQIPD